MEQIKRLILPEPVEIVVFLVLIKTGLKKQYHLLTSYKYDKLINKESIWALINFINIIINNKHLFDDFKIYLHIKCKGGVFADLINFIKFKTQCIYEIVSIIDNECYDSGFILAALCSYRIITKNAKVYLSGINIAKNGDCYWNYFNQWWRGRIHQRGDAI